MNCHLVRLPGKCERFAGSMAEARQYRDLMIKTFDCKKKEVLITPEDISTNKLDLLDRLNKMLTRIEAEAPCAAD